MKENKKGLSRKSSILAQVATLFLVGVVISGILAFSIQNAVTNANVTKLTENYASIIADEVALSVREYPAYAWLLNYWYEHSGDLDVEYDVSYGSGTATEKKASMLSEKYPGVLLRYADLSEIQAMTEEDQKVYAEVTYSWLITRVDQIKLSWNVDFLFCVLTDETFTTQFFLFSAALPGEVRGTDYLQVYPMGVRVTVSDSQREAMKSAVRNKRFLADAGDYVDYYAYLRSINGHPILIGLTYNLSGLRTERQQQTRQGTIISIAGQVALSLMCLLLIDLAVLRPLKRVQRNIHIYKETKDSETVINNLKIIRSNNEIGQLSEDVADLAGEIDHYLNHIEQITADKERITTELALATRIQADMLPNIYPAFPERSEFDIYATMTPAKAVGGDFYDYFLIDEDHLYMVMADVSGKGVPAALFMMASKIILANHAMQGKSPAQILEDANATICTSNREEMFVTVWLGILEISTGKLTAANAGHEFPVIRTADGKFELYKDRHGFVVGGMKGMKYKNYEITLTPGAKLFVYTDGVPEATNAANELFGTDRMLEALNADTEANPQQVLENVRSSVDGFVKDAEQFDDLTMLCMEYRGRGEQTVTAWEMETEARIEKLSDVLAFVDGHLEEMGCPMKKQIQIDVAVEEIFVNIASYAYAPGNGRAVIRMEAGSAGDEVKITFIDWGVPYDPLAKEDPDVTLSAEERAVGGLGIFMVKKSMDDMQYEYLDGQNRLTLIKKL